LLKHFCKKIKRRTSDDDEFKMVGCGLLQICFSCGRNSLILSVGKHEMHHFVLFYVSMICLIEADGIYSIRHFELIKIEYYPVSRRFPIKMFVRRRQVVIGVLTMCFPSEYISNTSRRIHLCAETSHYFQYLIFVLAYDSN